MGKELYDNIPSKIQDIMLNVRTGRTGLPDLQRPFVWPDSKVRDLFDSMLKGYPIGYIMLWASPEEYDDRKRHIGGGEKIYKAPDDLIIDGQQRITGMLAAMYGLEVKDKSYKNRRIRIAFNPLTRSFEVWTAAIERNAEFISDISEVFLTDVEKHDIPKLRRQYIKDLNASREKKGDAPLTDEDEITIEDNLNDLLNLNFYLLPTLKISSKADEEDVAEIFVRVNSGGTSLTEKDFIKTLIAVYDNDMSDEINAFCAESRVPADGTAYNQIIAVEPQNLIRIAVGVGFRRARLKYAYMLLRGKDLDTGEITAERREENLTRFRESLHLATNLNNWHNFLNLFPQAGYIRDSFIASGNAVVFSYVLYLIGKYDYKVPAMELNKIIRKWIYMATVTYYYSGSTESNVEKQFADLRGVSTAEEYVAYLDNEISSRFNDDYFSVTLPNELATSAGISPAWNGYVAALNVLGTPTLFNATPLSYYLALGASGDKRAYDKHHIFPKHYLETLGIDDDRDRNQIANFTYLDYNTNIDIGDSAPAEYVGRYREKLGEAEYRRTCEQNALPEGFENMDYFEFLEQRRKLMAQIIKKAYLKLCE